MNRQMIAKELVKIAKMLTAAEEREPDQIIQHWSYEAEDSLLKVLNEVRDVIILCNQWDYYYESPECPYDKEEGMAQNKKIRDAGVKALSALSNAFVLVQKFQKTWEA